MRHCIGPEDKICRQGDPIVVNDCRDGREDVTTTDRGTSEKVGTRCRRQGPSFMREGGRSTISRRSQDYG